MNSARFAALVRRAVAEVPEPFRSRIAGLKIVVQDEPTPAQLRQWELGAEDADLLGFYDGVPLTERSEEDPVPSQDAIYVFRRAHLEMCADDEELAEEVRKTVIHEIGHHFGLDDDRIDELGYA
jgi:predicted Zn-dependent protease with MMP-like domain